MRSGLSQSSLVMAATFVVTAMLVGSASPAEARVFNFQNARAAIYFGGSFGNSNVGATAFDTATPTDVVYDKKVSTTASGEAGLLFSGTRFNLRLGAEYLMPREQVAVNGVDAAETNLFSLTSSLSALVPTASIEYMPYRGALTRALIGVGYGYAFVSLSNQYTMTTAGQTRFGKGDYKETGTGTASVMQAYLGWEFILADTTTVVFHAGYRYCVVQSIRSTQDTNAISGTQKTGEEILNYDGTSRKMDLSGGFAGLNFRFFL